MPRIRPLILVALCASAVVGCWPDALGPTASPVARFSVVAAVGSAPSFSVVPLSAIHLRFRRSSGEIALDTTLAMPTAADSVVLDLSVPLSSASPSNPPTERFEFTAALTGPAGDTVFVAGPDTVDAVGAGAVNALPAALRYVGVGFDAASVDVAPASASLVVGDTLTFVATARDSSGAPIPGTPVVWSSLDPSVVSVASAASGAILAGPREGSGRVVARLLTGQADTVTVSVTGTIAVTNATTFSVGIQLQGVPGTYQDVPADSTTVIPLAGSTTLEVWECVSTACRFEPTPVAAGDSYRIILTPGGQPLDLMLVASVQGSAQRIAQGYAHACALTDAGEAYCWGYNAVGQLGDGTTVSRTTPVRVAGGIAFTSLWAGFHHTCGLTATGEAYCWGYNLFGQLGDGTTSTRSTPVPVAGGLPFSSLGPGYLHTCGVTTTGAAYCWGENSSGALGDGTTVNRMTPAPVVGGMSFSTMTTGFDHTCGLTPAGAAYCWGDNGEGQLGDGTSDTQSLTPVAVTGGLAFAELAAGSRHTCGLTQPGEAYCWGDNSIGQLGTGTTSASIAVPGAVTGGLTFTTLSSGSYFHTCGLTSGGAAYCWGYNYDGQLGTGSISSVEPSPVAAAEALSFSAIAAGGEATCGITGASQIHCWGDNTWGALGDGTPSHHAVPVAVAGGLAFSDVGAGGSHTCGVTTGGPAYCWGGNLNGELGDGTTFRSPQTTPAPVVGGMSFSTVATGSNHTCGLTPAGEAYCWGYNYAGQLGDGTTVPSTEPVAVAGGLTFTDLTTGGTHTCGVASSGEAYCWGNNFYGQLGSGSLVDTSRPVPVSGGFTFSDVSAGQWHTCGVASGGAMYCWGNNSYGQLGDGTTVDQATPVPVSGGFTYSAVTLGWWHSCGITPGDAAYCWGRNFSGELGNGGGPSTVPAAVAGALSFTSLDAGAQQTCGIASGGSAYCWGGNFFGQLGDGSQVNRTTPAPVIGGVAFSGISVGGNHTCALAAAGAAYCWGYKGYGQLGDGSVAYSPTPVRVQGF